MRVQGFPKIRDIVPGVPIIRNVVFRYLFILGVPLVLGNYHIQAPNVPTTQTPKRLITDCQLKLLILGSLSQSLLGVRVNPIIPIVTVSIAFFPLSLYNPMIYSTDRFVYAVVATLATAERAGDKQPEFAYWVGKLLWTP